MLIVFHWGTRWLPNSNVSSTRRSDGSGGKMNIFCAWYSFRMSFFVLRAAGELLEREAAALRRREVHGPHDGRRPVDRHRHADLVERQLVEERLHVGGRVDGDADLAPPAARVLVGRGVALQRGGAQRGGEARLALREEELESLVRLLGGAKARELAHRPQAAAVHRGLHAARERELARIAQVAVVVEAASERSECGAAVLGTASAFEVPRPVQPLDGLGRGRGELLAGP